MAITLNSTLKAALDGIDHKPIIDINTQSLVNSIPITPTKLPKEFWKESNSVFDRPRELEMISTPDGRLVMLYTGFRWFYEYENPNPSFSFMQDGYYYYLAMRVSDIDRREFGKEVYLYVYRTNDGLPVRQNRPISAVALDDEKIVVSAYPRYNISTPYIFVVNLEGYWYREWPMYYDEDIDDYLFDYTQEPNFEAYYYLMRRYNNWWYPYDGQHYTGGYSEGFTAAYTAASNYFPWGSYNDNSQPEQGSNELVDFSNCLIRGFDNYFYNFQVLSVSGIPRIFFAKSTSTDIFDRWPANVAITQINIPSLPDDAFPNNVVVKTLSDNTYLMTFTARTGKNINGQYIRDAYYSTSNDLINWSTIQKITESSAEKTYNYPYFSELDDGRLLLTITEHLNYVQLGNIGNYSYDYVEVRNFWVDYANGKIYATLYSNQQTTYGDTAFVKIDIATFTVESYYDKTTVPAIPSYFSGGSDSRNESTGPMICFYQSNGALVADYANNILKAYYIRDMSGTHGPEAAKNVDITFRNNETIAGSFLDYENQRLYLTLFDGYYWTGIFTIGYIDLTQTTPPYTFTEVFYSGGMAYDASVTEVKLKVYPDDDLILVSIPTDLTTYWGTFYVIRLSDGGVIKKYTRASYKEFPHRGFWDVLYINGRIYATVAWGGPYELSEPHKYGLAEIDIDSDVIIYHKRPYTDNKTGLNTMYYNQYTNEINFGGDNTYAGQRFDVLTNTWIYLLATDFNNGSGRMSFYYDPLQVYISSPNGSWSWGSVTLTGKDGQLRIIKYAYGEKTTQWEFDNLETLVYGYSYTRTKTEITDGQTYIVFDQFFIGENSIFYSQFYWGDLSNSKNINEFIVGEVSTNKTIEGQPHSLSLNLSHGHLLDPSNTSSLINKYIKKGAKLVVRFGEKVAGVDYFQDEGSFIITEMSLTYKRGDYPLMMVKAEDKRIFWDQHNVEVGVIDNLLPANAIQQTLLAEKQSLTVNDFDLPVFAGGFTFSQQYIDTDLKEIIDQIANRFKYFMYISVNDKITAKLIDLTKTFDHFYRVRDTIIDYSPDDSFTDFTNRIVVTGESLEDTEVVYAEERVGSLNGTVGWYGFKKDYKIWYSDDKSRRVRFPRLEVIETSTSILFQLSGKIRERISERDINDKYCVVEVSAPNLVPLLLAAIATYIAGVAIGDGVVGFGAGMTVPIGRVLEGAGMYLAMMVLGSIGNFQYEIWGRPVGYVKRSVSNAANDLEMQQLIGERITNKIEGFLCDTSARCLDVANFEMSIAKAQRNRIRITKIAHLQDEVGDVIQFIHPYSDVYFKVFITNINRKFKRKDNSGDGYFYDDIEGWVIQ